MHFYRCEGIFFTFEQGQLELAYPARLATTTRSCEVCEWLFSFTKEKSHSKVQSVTRVSHIQMSWRFMSGHIQERSHSSVQSVTRASQEHTTGRHMREPILERSHFIAISVTRASHNLVLWRNMKRNISYNNTTSVYNVQLYIVLYWKIYTLQQKTASHTLSKYLQSS